MWIFRYASKYQELLAELKMPLWNDGIGMSSPVGVRHGAPDSLLLYHLLDLLLLLRLSPIRQQRVVLVFIPDEKMYLYDFILLCQRNVNILLGLLVTF